MTETVMPFAIKGPLLDLWNKAREDFMRNASAGGQSPMFQDIDENPEAWLSAFEARRHKPGSKLHEASEKVGKNLVAVLNTVKVVGGAVKVVVAGVPAAAPAALVVNAFAWLFESFANISKDFDKVAAYFRKLLSSLENMSLLSKSIAKVGEWTPRLQECIVNVFICSLRLCSLAMEQAGRRRGHFDQLAEADRNLSVCVEFATLGGIVKIQDTMKAEHDEKEKDRIIKWLSKLNFSNKQKELDQRVSEDSVAGRWLLQSELFQDWRDGDCKRLWYTGDPGAGKSVLASIIVKSLRARARERRNETKGILVACIYLSYDTRPTTEELLVSILHQFQTSPCMDEIHPEIFNTFRRYSEEEKLNEVRSLEKSDVKKLLSQITATKTAYIVVDALDERDYKPRLELLDHIQSIGDGVKLLVTSRVLYHMSKIQKNGNFKTARIEAHQDDTREYIQKAIAGNDLLEGCREKIIGTVHRKAKGMFIIVRLHTDAVSEAGTVADVEEVLRSLPDSIEGTYKQTMTRIRDRSGHRKYAEPILGLVTFAQRTLSVDELRHALAARAKSDGTNIEESDLLSEEHITSMCCGLLAKSSDNMVRFFHLSAYDYFQKNKNQNFPGFDRYITIACAKYLLLPPLLEPQDSFEDLESHILNTERRPFHRYAAANLHRHCRAMIELQDEDDEAFLSIQKLVGSKTACSAYGALLSQLHIYGEDSSVLRIDDLQEEYCWVPQQERIPPLHIATFLGSRKLVQELIDEGTDANVLDPYQQPALFIAIQNELDGVADVLLRNGAKVDLLTHQGHTFLLYAAAMHRDFTKSIQQIIGNVTEDREGLLRIVGLCILFLFWASKLLFIQLSFGHLLHADDSKDHQSLKPRTSNHTHDLQGSLVPYWQVLRLAYRKDADCLERLRGLLANQSVDLELLTRRESADHANLEWSDAAPYESNTTSETDESDAEQDIGLDATGPQNNVLEEKARSDRIKADFLRTACFLAVERGYCDVVKAFLDNKLNPDLKNYQEQSLLHRATARNDFKMVKLILDQKYGATVDIKDGNGRTALLANASIDEKKAKVLKFLLENGAKKNLTYREGCSEVYEAAVYGATHVVQFLLDNGVDPSITNNFGWTPLHGAAANGHPACVKLLLEKGAKPSPVSDTGRTPRDFVEANEVHYDWILSDGAKRLYSNERLGREKLTAEELATFQDDIMDLLEEHGAMTGAAICEKVGREEYERLQSEHPGWDDEDDDDDEDK